MKLEENERIKVNNLEPLESIRICENENEQVSCAEKKTSI